MTMEHLSLMFLLLRGVMDGGESPEEARSELNDVFEMIRKEYLEAGQSQIAI